MGRWQELFARRGLFSGEDIRVTFSQEHQSRSESSVSINPADPSNLVAASKKFIDPSKYHFTVSTSYSLNSGYTWTESPITVPGEWDGLTDPVTAFDSDGNAFLIVGPLKFQPEVPAPDDIIVLGVYIFKSTNGGQSWSKPMRLDVGDPSDVSDDKQWIACDNNPSSPHYGNIYAAWGASSPLRFARSTDHGKTWKGVGSEVAGTKLNLSSFAPEISVCDDGTILIVWHSPYTSQIDYVRSTDGGESFSAQMVAAAGIRGLHAGDLPIDPGEGFPHFPGAEFRVLTIVSAAGADNRCFVAWSDTREGVARIYYRIGKDVGQGNGVTWIGPSSGQPLLPWLPSNNGLHHFHPQIIATKRTMSGQFGSIFEPGKPRVIACAFYEFGLKGGKHRIDTRIAGSFSKGEEFEFLNTVTDSPWDPALNAPWAHGNPNQTFIGEYFGLDADEDSLAVLWTDTRTGVQELFFDRVTFKTYDIPEEFEGISGQVFGGVAKGGDGFVIVGGKIIKIPPRGPKWDILNALAALDAVEQIGGSGGTRIVRSISEGIEGFAKQIAKKTAP